VSNQTAPLPRAANFIAAFEDSGVTHVVGLPDNTSAALFEELGSHPAIECLTVTREGEAFAIASGLWLGGKRPVVVIQNTGLLESGDSLRGTAMRMAVPLLCIITYRGFEKMVVGGRPIPDPGRTRPDLDSVALATEPTLEAWGVPHHLLDEGDHRARVGDACDQAHRESRPVALLIPRTMV
jgi:sulfopyruvate decarboxylase TPP-binding subunit